MTFSLIGRCPRTGRFGAAVATSSIAVGSRVAFAEAGTGAVLTQHRTDPRLGPRGLALLRSGCTAREALDALVASTPHAAWRQLAALDAAGSAAAHSGARTKPERGEAVAADAVAIGNILASPAVPDAMLRAFQDASDAALAERLMRALEAGLAAGGEHLPVRSGHLLVAGEHGFPRVDLRVDWDEAPIAALRALWDRYAPMEDDFLRRALTPDDAPVR